MNAVMPLTPEVLETRCEWSAENMRDPASWTETLSEAEIAELEEAIGHARSQSDDFLQIKKADFPLDPWAAPAGD